MVTVCVSGLHSLLEPQFNNPKGVGSPHWTLRIAMRLSEVLADSQGSCKEGTINMNISVTKMPSMAIGPLVNGGVPIQSAQYLWSAMKRRGSGEHVLADTQLNPPSRSCWGSGSKQGDEAVETSLGSCPGSRVCHAPSPTLQRLSVCEVTSLECRSLLAFIILNKAYILKLSCACL